MTGLGIYNMAEKISYLPGFNARSSLFGSNSSYRHLVKKYHSGLQIQTEKVSINERWKIPEAQREPSISGRLAWTYLERACHHLQCEQCRKDCLRFINGLHDAINIKLGKPLRTPNDLVYLSEFINAMTKIAFNYRRPGIM
jgi:hypothetical protein